MIYGSERIDAVGILPLAGFGLAYEPKDLVRPTSPMGRLKRVLRTDALHIQATTSGYHLYYPNPRQRPPLPCWSSAALPELNGKYQSSRADNASPLLARSGPKPTGAAACASDPKQTTLRAARRRVAHILVGA